MKNIKLSVWGIPLVLTVLWLLANADGSASLNFISLRNYLVQYSGVIAIGVMSVAMVLATRPRWLESFLGGLDKGYRLHKWLGITAMIMAIVHWLAANAPHWLVGLGLLERGQKGPRPDPETLSAIQRFFGEQRGIAESIGEWAFYALIIFIVLALIKRVPYRWFAQIHKLFAVLYLAFVWHTLVLTKFSYWSEPLGVVIALLMIAGVVSAVLVFLKMFGFRQRVKGTIEKLEYFPLQRVIETTITMDEGWRGHKAGQFAFVTHDRKEGAHPYTISSAWNPVDRRIVFTIKALGDFTERLPEQLQVGDRVELEGAYGRFTFGDGSKRQIWIGAGIGITPFIARLEELGQSPHQQDIDLFHSVAVYEQEPIERLTEKADQASVNVHLLVGNKDGKLNGKRLRDQFPDWASASFWFCGPSEFGDALRKDLVANGLAPEDFHQELFNMR